ncbi:M61 family metallopeptidase [Vulcanococcus limneticus]|uniref:M61 family metallopeptidase n=1 Tax=Vulcanococcus limneticus TaxID=2170428 RepID=UPI00398BF49B
MVDLLLNLQAPHRHLVEVSLRLVPRTPVLRLRLPAWTPGSYLIRDYVRQLEGLEAHQGERRLALRRLDPSCWELACDPSAGELEIRYRVMANELTVRTCHLDSEHGFLALAAVVLELEGERWSPHRLRLQLPEGWRPFLTLPEQADGSWLAPDFDALVDSPLEVGPHREHRFVVRGVPHRWVTWGGTPEQGDWLLERFPALFDAVAAVAESCCRLMGSGPPPCREYLVVLHLTDDGYGGLEHDHGTVLVYGRRALETPNGLRKLLQLFGHEYLHQWNVRRLRPAELTPIDYQRPPIVPTLWFAEGITSYLDQFLPLLAGRSSAADLLDDLGEDLSRYRLTPGRSVQSLRDSSQEAWVKLYRADAYAADSQISYYLKGAVLALVLDLHLRRQGSCLAAVLRGLWQELGQWGRGYREADLLAAFAAAAPDLAALLPAWLEGLEDPDLDGYLWDVGMQLTAVTAPHPWIGLVARREAGQLTASRVHRDGPAEAAGVMVGDELLALEGRRLRKPEELGPGLLPGQAQELLICRRGQLRALTLRPGPARTERWSLEEDPQATPEAMERRQRWLDLVPC